MSCEKKLTLLVGGWKGGGGGWTSIQKFRNPETRFVGVAAINFLPLRGTFSFRIPEKVSA